MDSRIGVKYSLPVRFCAQENIDAYSRYRQPRSISHSFRCRPLKSTPSESIGSAGGSVNFSYPNLPSVSLLSTGPTIGNRMAAICRT